MPGNNVTTIQSVPDDVLAESLSFLPQSELLEARNVNRRFEEAALKNLKQRELTLVDAAAGCFHTIALMQDKQGRQQLFAWGCNIHGQLGLGNNAHRNIPQALDMNFLNGAQITQLAPGFRHTLIQTRTAAGKCQLFAWGNNEFGQLGLGNNADRNIPQALDMNFLPHGAQITQLVARGARTLIQVQTAAGEPQLFAWGDNEFGQLGLGNNAHRNTPQALDMGFLPHGAQIAQVAAGWGHTLIQVQTAAGEPQLFAWGYNEYGQLGLGNNADRNTPQALDMGFLPHGAQITKLAAVGAHTFIQAQTATGKSLLFAWGYNEYGQLGLGDNADRNTPQPLDIGFLPHGAQITKLAAVGAHTLIQTRTADGERQLFAWGNNRDGQLGLGDNAVRNTPQALDMGFLPEGAQITQLAASNFHSLIQAQTATGKSQLFAWGYNVDGQLGLGHNVNRNTPQQLRLGPFKPVHHQLSVRQTERRLARLINSCGTIKQGSSTPKAKNRHCLP